MNTEKDNEKLIAFWNQVFAQSEEESGNELFDPEELAPSKELYLAAASMAEHHKVLDYGCGSAWASIIMAHHGCEDITAADPAKSAVKAALQSMSLYHMTERIHPVKIDEHWLNTVAEQTYDGIFCSNVLDVIPEETARDILIQFHRIAKDDADVIIGMNYYLSPQTAETKGLELIEGKYLYVDGVLRLVSKTDEEWKEFFSPYFEVKNLQYFSWPGEKTKTRRLFTLKRKSEKL